MPMIETKLDRKMCLTKPGDRIIMLMLSIITLIINIVILRKIP